MVLPAKSHLTGLAIGVSSLAHSERKSSTLKGADGASIKMPRNAVFATSDSGAVIGENGEIAE